MDNINQVSQTPEVNNNQMPSNNTPSSKIIPIGLGILFVLVTIGSYILGTKQNQTVVSNKQSSVVPTTIPSPTPDETTDWITYENKQYNFSLRYPLEMNLSERDDEVSLAIKGETQRQGQELHDGLFITIRGLIKTSSTSFEDFIKSQGQLALIAEDPGSSVRIEKNESFNLNGIQGKRITGSELGSDFIEVFLLNNQQVIQIKANHGGNKDAQYLQTFDQILSTFQFTSP
ncbi:MAG: hypothetical protein HYT07_00675 [Candidatus Levybacteria bacterium]|nr:hypothetical protein [Candidatus Levybacteria bacterium]